MKVWFSTLPNHERHYVFYIDYSIFVADTYDKCLSDTSKAVDMLVMLLLADILYLVLREYE